MKIQTLQKLKKIKKVNSNTEDWICRHSAERYMHILVTFCGFFNSQKAVIEACSKNKLTTKLVDTIKKYFRTSLGKTVRCRKRKRILLNIFLRKAYYTEHSPPPSIGP